MSYVNKQGNVVKSFFEVNGFMVYPITHNLIDLFWGRGFTNHARFKFQGGSWNVWKKSSNLPREYQDTLQAYAEQRYLGNNYKQEVK
jgi:hypothetical protein